VSDALCISPALAPGRRPLRHFGDTLAPTATGDYAPSLRSPWRAAEVLHRQISADVVLPERERKRIQRLLRRELSEIFYGRNLARDLEWMG
jgi:hypothetical protein